MEVQIPVLIKRSCHAWKKNPDESNVIEAAIALERCLQLVIRDFMLRGLPKHGAFVRPDKEFERLALGELIDAAFSQTLGQTPIVPIEFLRASLGRREKPLWAVRKALGELNRAARIYLAHSKLDEQLPFVTKEISRDEKLRLIEATLGVAIELGLVTAGDREDCEEILGRRLNDVPALIPEGKPVGLDSRPGRPYAKFIGREKAIKRVVEHVETARSPISVEGEGGYGKTALAWEVTEQVSRRGTFVALAWVSGKVRQLDVESIKPIAGRIRGELQLLTRICEALRIQAGKDVDSVKDDLQSFFVRNKTLVVIDNWEDFPPGTDATVDWISQYASVVVTSRPDAGLMAKQKLDRLSRAELVQLLQSEYQAHVGRELRLDESEKARLDLATAGSPLAVTWIVQKIFRGGYLSDCFDRLEAQGHHLLEYCYRDLIENLSPAGTRLARLLVASGGSMANADARQLLTAAELQESVFDLGRISVVVVDAESNGEIALTPLCLRYLQAAWAADPEQQVVSQSWKSHEEKQGACLVAYRYGPVRTAALEYYQYCKGDSTVAYLKNYVQLRPLDPWGHYYLGIAHRKWGEPSDSVSSLGQAILLAGTLDEQHRDWQALMHREMSLTYSRAGDAKSAVFHIERALGFTDEASYHVIHATALCDDRRVNEGIPKLLDLASSRSSELHDAELRRMLTSLLWHSKKMRAGNRPDMKFAFLVESIGVVEQHERLLDPIKDWEDVVALFHAAIDSTACAPGDAAALQRKAYKFIRPGMKVRLAPRGLPGPPVEIDAELAIKNAVGRSMGRRGT